jgi:hypothetical protein
MARAALGPTPETPSSISNSDRSASDANPNSWSASSRTCRWVSSVTSRSPAAAARREAVAVVASR